MLDNEEERNMELREKSDSDFKYRIIWLHPQRIQNAKPVCTARIEEKTT